MLALAPGRTVSADRLAEGLWGEAPPPSAAKMVQLYVSHLRRVLDGDGVRIVTHGRGYELELAEGDIDAVRFERLLEQSRPREALALWHGDALVDLADEPFAATEIRRLDELRLRASESAIDADLDAGRHAEVIGELERLIAEEPLREHLRAQHMLALYRAGRQSDALEAYRGARAVLVDEVGVEPGVELRGLQEAILAHDPALDLPAPDTEPATSPGSRSRRARVWLLAGAAVLLLAGITAFGVIRVLEPEGLAGIHENSVGLINPDGLRITKEISVGAGPSAATEGGGSVWIANAADGTVSRIDRRRDEAVRIAVGGAPAAVAFGGGSLWVADSESRDVVQVDPGANQPVSRITVGNAPRALAVTPGALWVASGVDGRIRKIDLDTGRPGSPIGVGTNPSALAAGAGALWVASEESGTITRIDPRSGRVVQAIPVGSGASAVAVGEGAVWVVNRQVGTLARIDPERNAVTWSGAVGSDPTAVAVGEGAVWVAGGEEGTVVQVDPDGPRVVERRKTGSSPAAIAVAGGSVWAAADAPRSAHRGGTLRVLIPSSPKPRQTLDWLNPQAYDGWAAFSLESLAYDGLVAYRRVEGAAGATIVGALATTVPPASRDGQSYVFTLRRGLRYSDGRPVRPADFRASMERFLQAMRDLPANQRPPDLYEGIVGARRCMAASGRCDLSRGIEADAQTRTISVHLTRPDPEFLHKLTVPFASVVPADSPTGATAGRTPPGTGPYRVAAWDSRRGGTFERNPYFLSGPARSRGAGFADRIEIVLDDYRKIEQQIAATQRGSADVAILADTFGSELSPARLRALAAQAPGRLSSTPAASSEWIYLNVRRRPFDDPRVRRAVNFAIDRDRVVTLGGGREVGQPSCQILPAGFPGHEPYCPYTAKRAEGRGWSAPDLDQARRLVAASGRAGEHVVVHAEPWRAPVARYYTRLLDDLGFRATLAFEPGAGDYRRSAQPQTGFTGWLADRLTPGSFLGDNFACAVAGEHNVSRLCDRELDRLIDRAQRTPPAEAGPAWAAADRRVTDLAAAVPLTSRRVAVLISKRVGNVKTHGQWFTLLDQMWVR